MQSPRAEPTPSTPPPPHPTPATHSVSASCDSPFRLRTPTCGSAPVSTDTFDPPASTPGAGSSTATILVTTVTRRRRGPHSGIGRRERVAARDQQQHGWRALHIPRTFAPGTASPRPWRCPPPGVQPAGLRRLTRQAHPGRGGAAAGQHAGGVPKVVRALRLAGARLAARVRRGPGHAGCMAVHRQKRCGAQTEIGRATATGFYAPAEPSAGRAPLRNQARHKLGRATLCSITTQPLAASPSTAPPFRPAPPTGQTARP